MGFMKKIMGEEEEVFTDNADNYYGKTAEEALKEDGGAKMILLEPRAYSEAQQISDHLKKRNTVVVNLKRVTPEQAKRIVDFLGGTIYAINGKIQKIGGGIFLCTPNNVSIQGEITGETDGKGIHNNNEIDIEW
jgi:FtsZ-interacting cell division protein YlmF